ncbi:hypothetical protein [Actinomadura rupiterrae]|uniref:hypothetical protein n=1 Tax=Actinomadura rupiterrae TaxID=559627 RepID=UPI0020A2D8BF|nr:hypothetical protein [Actinomadura rupiterrae]MCP2340795.1 hypothetical protein [Actinomadura rupiterrae]
MRAVHRLRRIANWANLSTPLGLLLARAGTRPRAAPARGPEGLLLAGGYRLPVPAAPAFTMGNVVIARGDAAGLAADPPLLAHEARHATQYAWCLGPVMLVPYLACAGVSLVVCGDAASYNPFERLAGLSDGGYERRPPRPLFRRLLRR